MRLQQEFTGSHDTGAIPATETKKKIPDNHLAQKLRSFPLYKISTLPFDPEASSSQLL